MIRILIADDHTIVRQGLRQVLALAPDMVLAGEARNGNETLARVRAGGLDLLLTDITMPDTHGVDLIEAVRQEAPDLPMLVLSMHDERQIAMRAIQAGASGYLTKDSEPETLIAAIRKVAAGGNFIDPQIAARLVFEPVGDTDGDPRTRLSEREYQVFGMLAAGQSVNAIADQLHLSAKTISTHKFRIMQKLELDSLSELVRCAVRHGLIKA